MLRYLDRRWDAHTLPVSGSHSLDQMRVSFQICLPGEWRGIPNWVGHSNAGGDIPYAQTIHHRPCLLSDRFPLSCPISTCCRHPYKPSGYQVDPVAPLRAPTPPRPWRMRICSLLAQVSATSFHLSTDLSHPMSRLARPGDGKNLSRGQSVRQTRYTRISRVHRWRLVQETLISGLEIE